MKSMKLKSFARYTGLAVAAVVLSVSAASGGEDDLVSHISEGRETFVRICGSCHGVDKPETKNMERPDWDELITSMEAKGAKLTTEERELILDYLGMRNVFLTKCTACHTTERILDRTLDFASWKATVTNMSQKMPELLEEGEVRSIVAYLTALRGAPPAAE